MGKTLSSVALAVAPFKFDSWWPRCNGPLWHSQSIHVIYCAVLFL